jgi:DNA-binding MarR family transcriptional regulator
MAVYHGRMTRLSQDEMALWRAWKQASETVRTRVAADIMARTGLSDPDFSVLTRLAEDGGGRMRQNQLAASMGYHRSRLSHHLSRMRERGLVTTEAASGGVDVAITAAGRELVRQARPVHAEAVRRHLIDPLAGLDVATVLTALERLTG